MKVHVLFFARARDLAGCESVEISLPDNACVGDVRDSLAARFPGLAPLLPAMFLALDNEYVDDRAAMREGCTVACFPPVSGG